MEALSGAAASSSLLPIFPTYQPPSRVALRARPCGPLRAAATPGGGKDEAVKPNGTPVIKVTVPARLREAECEVTLRFLFGY